MLSPVYEGFAISGDMNALLGHFHNFFLPLMRGHEHVCQCVCGSDKAYHVVSYHGAMSAVDIRDRYYGSYILTQQEMDLTAGILLGFCIGWLLMWLDLAWHRTLPFWTPNQLSSVHLWSLMPKFRNIRNLFSHSQPEHSEQSSGNVVHVEPQVNGNILYKNLN